jgi:hypothetical protein
MSLGHILCKLWLKGRNRADYEVTLNGSFCPQGCQLHSAASYVWRSDIWKTAIFFNNLSNIPTICSIYFFIYVFYPVCPTCFSVSCTILKENVAYLLKIVSSLQGYYKRYIIMYKIYHLCRITVFFRIIKTMLYFILYNTSYVITL